MQASWELNGDFELKNIEKACQFLVQRHDILRTRFAWHESSEPVQIVENKVELPCEILDLRGMEYPAKRVEEIRLADQALIMGCQNAPLFRVKILQLADNRFYLIWHFNHIIIDGWSFSILVNEFQQYCQAYQQDHELNLTPSLPFVDYVHWQQNQDWSSSEEYWRNYLSNFTAATDLKILGLSERLPENAKSESCFVKKLISAELSQRLRSFCQQQRLSLNTVFQALWGILLHRYTQTNDIVVGMTVSGRTIDLPQIQQRVGLFVNSIPLRMQFSSHLTVANFLQQLQKNIIELIPHSAMPLSLIQSGLPQPLFDSLVVFENYPSIAEGEVEFWDPTHYGLTLLITQG